MLQLPVGLSISVTIRVGNELGAGQPQRAKRAAYVGVALAGETTADMILIVYTILYSCSLQCYFNYPFSTIDPNCYWENIYH